MTDTITLGKPAAAHKPPYDELFIYYLQGRVREQLLNTVPAYIGTWEEDEFSFVFFSADAEKTMAALLQSQSELVLVDRFRMRYEEWQGGRVAAFRAGRFHVLPPWEAVDGSEAPRPRLVGEMRFLLDPGVVFGTGTHPTTRDCLAALEVLYGQTDIQTVLDLGTGTGILALAAARLGSRRVVAVDFNRLAARTTRHNINLNAAAERVLAVQGKAEYLMDCAADLVIANIHFDVMQNLLTSAGFRAKPYWILSGLLRSQARTVERLLEAGGGCIDRRWTRDHIWYTYLGHHEAV
jgi:ribosomal protein L11 methyltransferase